MALQTAYKQFLAAPSSSALAENASLHYITSTTSFSGPTEIIKHLNTVRNQVKKKKEEFLYAIEGQNALSAETETALEFVSSGGAYLPGLDDNFVSDRTVYFPIIHIVMFDGEGKITQIRQSWDQGSLLKQLEVIGKSGRMWPIRDTKDQLNLITRCIKSAGGASSAVPAAKAPAKAPANKAPADFAEVVVRSRGNSTNILRDPHASLALFAPREEIEEAPPAAVISPYAGRRPNQRSFTEILGDEEVEEPATPGNGRGRSMSPSKAIAPKIGAGKNFQPIRLFEADENAEQLSAEATGKDQSPDRFYRPNPKKYSHFDFADGSDPQDAPKAAMGAPQRPKSKHDSSWSFEDFVTPQKPTAGRTGVNRSQEIRHWGTENDVVEDSPVRKPQQVKARRDAEAHFELVDDGEPSGEPRLIGRPRGTAHNTGLGLYENNLYNEDGSAPTPGAPPLGNITNLKYRGKDFAAHFDFTDESPHHNQGNGNGTSTHNAGEDRLKHVRMMESNWSSFDESSASQKENDNPSRGSKAANDDRGISIAGDGMGGKKGSGRDWGIGDDSDEGHSTRAVPGKKQPSAAVAKSNFWDF
ncbi:hypothetical protein QBC46DRAFT_289113 [Diplogelasinospora grovesii]|uniref:NTF2-like protein n=1 Tax=Diplogelasinospora grovesii TaxID=303347 RepID=A0AAN6N7V2_9PEZI|nr:hypothetical protein QBC46DRAFT_289113 [Diplogelasinospora grovesii]